jgi:acyl-CoA synthetase (AMP-forming)/AMP-acid ligase II
MDLGVDKQDRVGILSDNSGFWIASYLAVMKVGAVAVPFPNRLSSSEVKKFSEATQCETFCAEPARLHRQGAGLLKPAKGWICAEEGIHIEGRVLRPRLGSQASTVAVSECTDLAALMFTSGSTGEQNAVMNDNHISCWRRLKFPATAERKRYKSEDLYGERSAGKAIVATGAEVVVGSGGSQGGHGCENGAKVPASATTAERDAAKTQVAHSARSVCGRLG